jgi:hypothetical protein
MEYALSVRPKIDDAVEVGHASCERGNCGGTGYTELTAVPESLRGGISEVESISSNLVGRWELGPRPEVENGFLFRAR